MTSSPDDVVVTGLGATTPLGGDVATFWSGLLEGRSGVVALTQDWAAELSVRIAAPMAVDPAQVMSRVQARRLDRSEQAAIVAAREAWADAGFTGRSDENGLDPARVAVVIGTGIGGVTSLIAQHDVMLARGPGRVSPLLIPMNMPNGSAAYVGLEIGARAGVHTPVSACASGAEAVAYGLDLIDLDRADIVVVGGTEACIHELNIAGFAQMRAMSTRNDEPERASRPFDKARDGFVLGEGAGVLVIERASSAAARGRVPYAVLGGAGVTADSYDIVAPDPEGNGQRRAAKFALEPLGGRRGAGRARERARDVHTSRRRRRSEVDRRSARRADRRDRHKVDDRSPTWRSRRDRGDRHRPGRPERRRAADDQPRQPR